MVVELDTRCGSRVRSQMLEMERNYHDGLDIVLKRVSSELFTSEMEGGVRGLILQRNRDRERSQEGVLSLTLESQG